MGQRVGGIIELAVNGEQLRAKGAFTYGLGKPTREGVVGADKIHGYKETPTVPFIEGEITDSAETDLSALSEVVDSTVTLRLANGKTIALRSAWCTNPDGLGANTEEGNVAIRFEGINAEEV